MKSAFASLIRLYLNEDVDFKKIVSNGSHLSYGDKLKMTYEEVIENFDKKRDEEIESLKRLLDKKLIKPVSGIISHFKSEYGSGEKEMRVYNFDEFLERVGPKTVSDIKSKLEEISYFGNVNIAVVGARNQYNHIIVTPAVSEPLGSAGSSFDSRVLETLDANEPRTGHDMGLTNAVELELYGLPPEKGF